MTVKKKERFCATILSTNFPEGFDRHFEETQEKTFVPLSDFNKLKKKYVKLFKRYQRESR